MPEIVADLGSPPAITCFFGAGIEEVHLLSPDRSLFGREGKFNNPCGRSEIATPTPSHARAAARPRRTPAQPPLSAIARRDVDLVHLVPVPVGLAEDRAMPPLEVDPGDRKNEFLRAAAERDGEFVADLDPRPARRCADRICKCWPSASCGTWSARRGRPARPRRHHRARAAEAADSRRPLSSEPRSRSETASPFADPSAPC